ncbi:hypothetical protein LUZ61_007238 [Rhynchospora tenuis]|uniref:Uncharacterized protein n=1 Tax=Rhynchospora tenuis TaxID=198213 RepID=A0AAD5ZT77_9POAL|nr:hypothetical protein LUZ61_007238 [Rhynchospora tenuis]
MDIDCTFTKSSCSPIKQWWSKDTVAVVTGANKGIGYALVKRLAELGLTVVLTARDINKGKEAVESLKELGLHVACRQLDVSDPSSIAAFASWLRQTYGSLDILVNNAGVTFNEIGDNSVAHADTVIKTNFDGPKMLIETLLPMFRQSDTASRILNMSSQLGLLNKLQNQAWKELLMDEQILSEEKIEQMVLQFRTQVHNGTWQEGGWPKVWTDYSVSKLALNAYSRLLANRYKSQNLRVNCFCPGFTRTSMTKGQGCHTAEEAANVAAMFLLLPSNELPTGKFFKCSSSQLRSKI